MELSNRTANILRAANLRIEDLAYIDPQLCRSLRGFGGKSYVECIAELKARGLEPGKWNTTSEVQRYRDLVPYYVAHRAEIQKKVHEEAVNLQRYKQNLLEQKKSEDIDNYRAETLRLVACSILQSGSFNVESEYATHVLMKRAVSITDMLLKEIK